MGEIGLFATSVYSDIFSLPTYQKGRKVGLEIGRLEGLDREDGVEAWGGPSARGTFDRRTRQGDEGR